MLRPLLPASIALELPAPDAAHVHVRASRPQLEQVVVNLAVNARDAMPDGGTLAFVVEREAREGGDPVAVLRVKDTGTGMSREIQERIFDPFFTTKAPGQGTGLGLSTVYGLVTRFGGHVSVASEPGGGSTFRVAFPLAVASSSAPATPTPPERAPEPAPSATPAAASEARRVLLAEDEAQLRNVTRRILERQGFVVTAVEHGGAALERLDAGERFDVVLTDAAMPVLGGAELARTIAERYPEVPVILMSGYAELAGGAGGSAVPPGVAEFLEKPYRVDHLLEVVTRVAGNAR